MTARVVITGIGAVTPAGIGWQKNWETLLQGRSGIRVISMFKTAGFRTRIAGEVADFDPHRLLGEKLADGTERFTQFALAAAKLALQDSRYPLEPDAQNLAVIMGFGMGGLPYFEQQADNFSRKGPGFVRPGSVPRIMPSAAAARISAEWKIRGPNMTISTACSSSNHAIGVALDLLRNGRCRAALCGGSESLLSPVTFSAFDTLHVMSNRNDRPAQACRPFDNDRDGFVMGEGAVIFVLETLAGAEKRGARVYAEVAGYGASNGAANMLTSEPDGSDIAQAMDSALADARVRTTAVNYVHAHGTGTRSNDVAETLGLKQTFKAHAQKLSINSTKPVTGHMLGAAGAFGILACALTLGTGLIPATLNYETPDPACDLDYVAGKPRKRSVEVGLCNAFAFGSNNASIVLKRKG